MMVVVPCLLKFVRKWTSKLFFSWFFHLEYQKCLGYQPLATWGTSESAWGIVILLAKTFAHPYRPITGLSYKMSVTCYMSVTYSVTCLLYPCYLSLICLLLVCCTVCYFSVKCLLLVCYFVLKDATYQAYYYTSNQWRIVSTTTDSTVLIKDT